MRTSPSWSEDSGGLVEDEPGEEKHAELRDTTYLDAKDSSYSTASTNLATLKVSRRAEIESSVFARLLAPFVVLRLAITLAVSLLLCSGENLLPQTWKALSESLA